MVRARRAKRGSLERELAELEPALTSPHEDGAAARIDAALASAHAHLVLRAAAAVREHRLERHAEGLLAAWARLHAAGGDADPGCQAKLAVIEALDYLEHRDAAPFVEASRCVQVEARWGKPEETAGNVRVRGALGLTRLRHADLLLVLGRLLGDPDARVRQGAADALAEHGDRDGAALLLLRLAAGEGEPSVLAGAIRALWVLAPDEGTAAVAPMLRDGALRELAAHAAVASNVEEGVQMLIRELDATVLHAEREVLLAALGVSRRPSARQHLLDRVALGSAAEARAVIRSLAVHAYDPRLAAAVREAAARNESGDLAAAVRDSFPEDG